MGDNNEDKTEVEGGVPLADIKPPLTIQVGVENGKVIVLFNQRLTTFTLPWDEAEKMADALYHHAGQAREALET